MKRWARFMYRYRWMVIGLWVVGFIGLQVASSAAGSAYNDKFSLPNVDSTRAFEILQKQFPTDSNSSLQIVFKAKTGTLTDAANAKQVNATIADVKSQPHVVVVSNPLTPAGASELNPTKTIGYANVVFDEDDTAIANEITAVKAVVDTALSHDSPTLQVEAGGSLVDQALSGGGGGPSELIGFLAAAVILAITFGTLVATAVPLVTAAIALSCGLAIDALLSHGFTIAQFTPQLASLIGLGVGIDYALFLVSRYRTELHHGKSVEDAVVTAVNTSGRAVTFAGITVCIALLGMIVLGVNFLVGVAVACSVAVAVTMFASVTFLPAFLGVLGHKIDKGRLRPQREHAAGSTRWERWAAMIQRRPVVAVTAGLIVVAILAIPFVGMRLGFSDAGTNNKDKTTRQAYDILGEGFGRGSNGPFLVTASIGSPADAAALVPLTNALRATDGVAFVSPPQVNKAKSAAVITLIPTTGPQDKATTTLLSTLRGDVVPTAIDGTGLKVYIGGSTAASADFSKVLSAKLPYFIGVVVLLSMLLLLIVFRSLAIPVQAAVMNLLSIAAAFGIVTAVFQYGWGSSLIGVSGTGPIEPFIPVIMFAILFGLSMDYEVFLVSRIHEEWVHSGENDRAVLRGLGTTAGVITAAAVIMMAVFGAFIFLPDRVIKIFGVGLAASIFVDAFVIRALVVPGVMFLVGKWNWWLPRWLDRILPELSIEGDYEEPVDEPGELAGTRG